MSTDSNINLPTDMQLRVLILTASYFGAFFPSIFTSVTCAEDFIPSDGGAPTSELYTTNYS